MPGTPVPGKLVWRSAPIEAIEVVTPRIKSFLLKVDWSHPFRAGQYVDLRLSAPDGYQAQRSYSIASAPADPSRIEIMVERLADGEVSGYFHAVAEPGDEVELRGPIGLPFSWAPADGGPLLLVGGGSGVVPLLSMLRQRAIAAPETAAVLLYSARSAEEVIRLDELTRRASTEHRFSLLLALTRGTVAGPGVYDRRVDGAMISDALARLPEPPLRTFVCGSAGFVGTVTDLLLDARLAPASIRTERFG